MAGAALSAFGDFTINTAQAEATGPDRMINEIQKKTYPLAYALKGREASEVVQGGKYIQDQLFLTEASTFETVLPGEDSTWQYPQVESEYLVRWRYCQDHMSWLDQTVDLNEGDPKVIFKREYRKIMARTWTSMINGMDGLMFAAPDKSTMEAAAGKVPYSIPVHCNEQTSTLFNTVTTAGAGGTWTVVQNIDPTTLTRWKSAQVGYGASGTGFTVTSFADAADSVLKSFGQMWRRIRFEMPPTRTEYFENPELGRQVIFASEDGIVRYEQLLRNHNNLLVGGTDRSDPSYGPDNHFRNIPIVYAPDLDTNKLYSKQGAATTLDTEAAADITGPRYYWVNFNYLKFVVHSKWYFRLMNEMILERQPNNHVIPIQTWCNLVCLSRRRQGIVYPTADN